VSLVRARPTHLHLTYRSAAASLKIRRADDPRSRSGRDGQPSALPPTPLHGGRRRRPPRARRALARRPVRSPQSIVHFLVKKGRSSRSAGIFYSGEANGPRRKIAETTWPRPYNKAQSTLKGKMG
jgi:hypothetical protein